MTDPLHDLRQLTLLAHQRTDRSRGELLQRITDIFLEAPGSYTEQQNACFGDIMERLAFALEWELREELACKIAEEVHAPRRLVVRLANDIISVARPILEQSPVLTEGDLIQLVRQRSQEHLLAVTRRADIGVRLASVLFDYGNDNVVESLLRNQEAEIASDTLEHAADRAKASNALQSALIDRRDVPKAIMLDLIENVSEKLREKLLDRLTQQDKANLEQVIDTLKSKVGNAEANQAELEIEKLARAGRLNEFVLLRFAKESKVPEFVLGLARLADIDVPTAWRALCDRSGTALAVICRANNFGVKTFKRIAMSPLTGIPSEPSRIYPLVWIYGRLSRQNAQRAMSHWRETKTMPQSPPAGAAAFSAVA
ncbi:MAG: DUF2336 domain-containing protein [Methyloligellaceae bacterium]